MRPPRHTAHANGQRRDGTRAGSLLRTILEAKPRFRRIWPGAFVLAFACAATAQDGSYDPSFMPEIGHGLVFIGLDGSEAFAALPLPDGRLLLAGRCNGDFSFCAARLNPDGGFDASFGSNQTGQVIYAAVKGYVAAGALLPNGDALIGGTDSTGASGAGDAIVARIAPSGFNDMTVRFRFAGGSSGLNALATQADGKTLAVGYMYFDPKVPTDTDFAIARLLPDLSPDPGFGNQGVRTIWFDRSDTRTDQAFALALQTDGSIVLAGGAATNGGPRIAVTRVTASGAIDTGFGDAGDGRQLIDPFPGIAANIQARAVALDRHGRILLAGNSASGSGHTGFVLRLLPNGSVDSSFGLFGIQWIDFDDAEGHDDYVNAIALQSDGKILLTGEVDLGTNPQGQLERRWGVARLLRNGGYDPSFGGGSVVGTFSFSSSLYLYSYANSIAVLGRGGLVIAGSGAYQRPDASGYDRWFGVARLRLDLIFADAFEP